MLGTAITKVCSTEIGRTGLNEREASGAGFEFVVATIEGTTRASYLPDPPPVRVKLVVEKGSGRLLGGQIVGGVGAAKRIDVVAACITAGFDVHQIIDIDFGYAPPMSPLWDPIAVAARRALSLLS